MRQILVDEITYSKLVSQLEASIATGEVDIRREQMAVDAKVQRGLRPAPNTKLMWALGMSLGTRRQFMNFLKTATFVAENQNGNPKN
jgi:hypothetical protein